MVSTFRLPKWIGVLISFLLFLGAFLASIVLGQITTPISTVYDAFFQFDASNTEHIIITTTRLSRALIAAVIGGSLAIAGALMQAITRNPLAAPDIFGINAGALCFIVIAATFFTVTSLVHYMWVGFLGAAVAGVMVYVLGSLGRDGLSPVKIVLAGAAITALFVSITQGLLVISEQNLQTVVFWLAGSVSGRSIDMLLPILPYMLAAIVIAFLMGRSITILMSGEDVAKGLGQRTLFVKLLIGLVIVILAGGSVAIGGAIGFIGLIIPHIVRGLVGTDYRWVLPQCALLGASLLLIADVVARFVIAPEEMPIGVMTAILGTPFFIYIARRGLAKNG